MISELMIPASELRQRFANKQIKLNDDVIDMTTYRQLDLESAIPIEDWLVNNPNLSTIERLSKLYSIDVMADCNSPILQEIFKGKAILRLSKKDIFIINENV